MDFDALSSIIDEILSINTSANVFVFGDKNVYHKDWLTILVELIDVVNPAIIFLSQMALLRWLTFLVGSMNVTLTILHLWIYLYFPTLVFFWEILIMG